MHTFIDTPTFFSFSLWAHLTSYLSNISKNIIRMASNSVVRTRQPDFDMLWMGLLISSLLEMFVDKTAAEERRKEMVLSMQQVRDGNTQNMTCCLWIF